MEPVSTGRGVPSSAVVEQDRGRFWGRVVQPLAGTMNSLRGVPSEDRVSLLPDELLVQVFLELPLKDAVRCRRVSQRFKHVLDNNSLPARAFYRRSHPLGRLSVDHNAPTQYQSFMRGSLLTLHPDGQRVVEQLDNQLSDYYFPESLLFSVAGAVARGGTLALRHEDSFRMSGYPKAASFSPDGGRLLLASVDGFVKVYDSVDGHWQESLEIHHSGWINDACFSPGGGYVGTASGDMKAKIFRNENSQFKEMAVLPHCEWVESICFSPDGNMAVTASGKEVSMWVLGEAGWQKRATSNYPSLVQSVSFSPNGASVAITSCDERAGILELTGHGWKQTVSVSHSASVRNVCYSPDGTRLAVVPTNDSICIWKRVREGWHKDWTIKVEGQQIFSVRFSPDGNRIAIASVDRVHVYADLNGKWCSQGTLEQKKNIHCVEFSPDGSLLLTASNDETAKLWKCVKEKWQVIAEVRCGHDVIHAQFSPDGLRIVITSWNNRASVYRIVGSGA